jgi:uncharacterized repeat protein (TIGR02543 family)
MKRRLLPILMTLVLVCALPIWAAFVTSGDVTNPLVSTAGATLPPEPVAVSNAADLQNRIADGKSVKLTDNITITSTLEIARSLTLDLNGYVLKMGGTGRVIHIIKSHGYDVKVEIKDGEPGKEHTGEYAALPAGGVITGGKADKGGGILLDGGCTLKLTGGCITDCHATDTGGGGVVLNGDTAILYMSGTARIENCTAGGMWGAAIFNSGTMYADGGIVDGTVNNQGTIRLSEGAAAETVFNGTVYNRSAGTIIAGIYNETVENNGTITGGTFYGPIVNEVGSGQVTGGTFAVTFDRGDGTKTGPELVGYKGTVSRPPSDPEKSGHTFVGWYLGDALYDFNTPVNAPLTLTARWEEVPSSGGNYYYHPTTDTKADDAKGSPKTADPGVALYAALSLLSLTGMVALNGKKR